MKSCLKISYHGEVSFIICEAGSNYQQIITQASARFHIDKTQRVGLVLTNGQGYVFDPQILEYFLQLFPCPELVFYLRLDWQKLRRALVEPIKRRRSADDIHYLKQQSESDYEAVPVHRQNCFIGTLPGTTTAVSPSSTSTLTGRRQLSSSSLVLRRLKKEKKQSPLQAQAKRMRLSLYNKSRRSAPPASNSHVNLLATNSRSIRI